MKEVVINGVEYLSATSLAKEFRYTTDYIGQLCRAKKVDAQLVGRSWYVNPLSLAAHKKARYLKVQTNDTLAAESVKVNSTKIDVFSALPKNTIPTQNHTEKNFAKRIDWQPLKYEADKRELMPPVSKQTATAKVVIKLADSTDIPIKISEKPINMVAEALPMVSLSGVLNVTSIEDNFHAEAGYAKPDVSLAEIPLPSAPLPVKSKPLVRPLPMPKKDTFHLHESKQEVVSSSILAVPAAQTISPVKIVEEIQSSHFVEITLVSVSGVLIISLFVLFFGESNILASADSYQGQINFSIDSLMALTSFFSH